jgi:iron complex outermembrane receptor protein
MTRINRRVSHLSLSSAVFVLASALASYPATAQNQNQTPSQTQATVAAGPAASASDQATDKKGEEIVIVGTAGAGTRRQQAAFAVTTLDTKAIAKIAPKSTADLFQAVPGVSSESTGGQNGANIFVRGYPSGGDAVFVTLQSEGVPFFTPPTLSFLENSQLIRVDSTLARVEAVRGGTGALFASGQPGLTVNFVQREGRQNFEGLEQLSVTDYGEVRTDGYVSGPLGSNTTFMAGGFYHAGHGIRDPQFTAEKGGQFTANVRHNFENGSLLVYGRYLNDHGQWLLPIPVIQNGNKIEGFPGFDPHTGTLASNDIRLATLNDGTKADLADGRGAKIVNLGANFEHELADHLTIRDRVSWLKGDADTTGVVPAGQVPQTAAAYAASLGSTIGSLTYTNGGAVVPNAANQLVTLAGFWVVRKKIESFANDAALAYKTGNNTFTLGAFYSAYSSKDFWNLGNAQLLTAQSNARRLDLTLADGRQVTRNGFAGGSFFNVNAAYDGRDTAFYAVDEFQITPKLRLDEGLRYQKHSVDGTLENNTVGVDTDNNPNTLYNNGTAVLNGTFRTINYDGHAWSYTAGANYDFTRQIGAFARYSHGNSFPFFDNLRDGLRAIQKVDTYEAGLKVSTKLLNTYLTVFHNKFEGLEDTVILNGAPVPEVGGARATGVELEGEVRPLGGLSLGFGATYLDAKYQNFFSQNPTVNDTGHQVLRQPKWAWRLVPAYEFSFGSESKLNLFSTIAFVADRFADVENLQRLPSYYRVDAGAIFDVDRHLQFSVTGDNLFNALGLTEGNPRFSGSTAGASVISGRPLLGRSFRFTAGYKF